MRSISPNKAHAIWPPSRIDLTGAFTLIPFLPAYSSPLPPSVHGLPSGFGRLKNLANQEGFCRCDQTPMEVVVNTTPIISLASIGQLELLQRVFGTIMIAEAVYQEIRAKQSYGYD